MLFERLESARNRWATLLWGSAFFWALLFLGFLTGFTQFVSGNGRTRAAIGILVCPPDIISKIGGRFFYIREW